MSATNSSDSEASTSARRLDVEDEHDDTSSGSEDESEDEVAEEAEGVEAEEDVPVLSHAEQRKQKKRAARAAEASKGESGDKDTSKKQKGTDKVLNSAELAPSKVPKRQNSIWVGNLSFKTTPEALKRFFDGCGEITRLHMPMKVVAGSGEGARKENRGFAYVDFAVPDAKVVAITLSENPLDGRRLLIKDGGDFTGRPAGEGDAANPKGTNTGMSKTAQKILRSQKHSAGPTLFFGNLSYESTEDSLRDMLVHHWKLRQPEPAADAGADGVPVAEDPSKWLRKIRMGTFEDSGKCKGWAFVDFVTKEHATTVLTNPRNHRLQGRELVVEYASADAVRRGGGAPKAQGKTDGPQRRPAGDGDGPRKRKARTDTEDTEAQVESPGKRRRVDSESKPAPAEEPEKPARKPFKEGKGPRVRAKPGAALAQAKREPAGIVPSQGQKIVF